jgi:hypothetical protein
MGSGLPQLRALSDQSTRAALCEARLDRMHPFCISIDEEGPRRSAAYARRR